MYNRAHMTCISYRASNVFCYKDDTYFLLNMVTANDGNYPFTRQRFLSLNHVDTYLFSSFCLKIRH